MKNKIPCPITDCDASEDGICITHSAIIIEETGYCQTGLEQMEKKMSRKTNYTCDVCRHAIFEGHQELFMVTLTTDHMGQCDDGSAAGTEQLTSTYHIHNDFSNHCMGEIWDLLVKDRK